MVSSNGHELAKFYGSRNTADERYRTAMEEEADDQGKFFLIQSNNSAVARRKRQDVFRLNVGALVYFLNIS